MPRGRPKKSPTKAMIAKEVQAEKDRKRQKARASITNDDLLNQTRICTWCGEEVPLKNYYLNNKSEAYQGNHYRIHICNNCINTLFNKISTEYGDERIALQVCCHLTDTIYVEHLCERFMATDDTHTFGKYLRYINGSQYANRTYSTDIIARFNANERQTLAENDLNNWNAGDLRNKNHIIKVLGIDPFEDCKDDDRKYMFNLCSEYFMDESLLDDPHKTQGVLEIVKTYKDIRNIDRQIDQEIRNGMLRNGSINESKLQKLSSFKKDMMELINKFAKENGISATVGGRGTKGSSSLAYYVKSLDEMDFTEAKVNLFDIATCDGIKQVADISNQSIWKQLQLTDDEKDEMILQQSKQLVEATETNESLSEQLRLTKLKLSKYEEIFDEKSDDTESDSIEKSDGAIDEETVEEDNS